MLEVKRAGLHVGRDRPGLRLPPLQSWTSICVPFVVPPPTGPRHLLLFAFIAIFQLLPLARMLNFCGSPSELAYCSHGGAVGLEALATSTDLFVADSGDSR